MRIRSLFFVFLLVFIVSAVTACGPARVEQFVEIDSNETAFLVPLEGASKSGQANFMSIKYLNENKVASKRVSLPLREHKTGRGWWNYEWIPTMRVVKVNRAPVTREWTGSADTGTAKTDQALWVESADSIGFGVGVNTTAMVKEEDTALFLYTFAGEPLSRIVDENVRGYVNSILSRKFAETDLEAGRKKKNEIINEASEKTVNHFAEMGVTITNLGLAEGLVYEDKEIQKAINDKFTAEMSIQINAQEKLAQKEVNLKNVSMAKAEKEAALEFKQAAEARVQQVQLEIKKMNAEANLTRANRWDGKLPANIMPSDSSFLYSVPANTASSGQ